MSARVVAARRLGVLLLVVALVSGCGPTMGDLPLPGNGVEGSTTQINVRFDDALNLAQGAPVKVNGVPAGKVRSVEVDDFRAVAVLELKDSARVRRTATARLRYTTPLGELFVEVTNPARGALLEAGEELDPSRASTAPTVEDALSSASLLINGGGLAQLQTVTTELNKALGGREDKVRSLLARSDEFLRSANATSEDFLAALDSMARVSQVLRKHEKTINAALRDIRPAAKVLTENTPAFTRLLKKVDQFASTSNRVVAATRDDLLTMLEQISPILDEFLANRAVLEESLQGLVKAGQGLDTAVPGDYANLLLGLQLDELELPVLGQPVPSNSGEGAGTGPVGGGTDVVEQLLGNSPLSGVLGHGQGGGSGQTGGQTSGGGLDGLLGGLLGGGRR